MARLHPQIKLILAIIIAIVVGIITDSLGWGIGSFFIAIFFFIWVWSWVFGSPFQSKVELTEDLETLIDKLEQIGRYKNSLPMNARGWVNSLGLYVQYREAASLGRLEAGSNARRSDLDATVDFSSGSFDWKVKKYNSGDWEDLVNPTFDIALWLDSYGGLPESSAATFQKAIDRYHQTGELELPTLKENSQ